MDENERIEKAFQCMGLSEAAAKQAARGRGRAANSNRVVGAFQDLGLSEAGAKHAARGRAGYVADLVEPEQSSAPTGSGILSSLQESRQAAGSHMIELREVTSQSGVRGGR